MIVPNTIKNSILKQKLNVVLKFHGANLQWKKLEKLIDTVTLVCIWNILKYLISLDFETDQELTQ